MTPEQLHAYRMKAAKKIEEKKRKEEDEAYYQKVSTGKQWLIFQIGAVLCALFSVVLFIDTKIEGKTKALPVGTYSQDGVTHERVSAAVWVDGDIYLAHYADFVSVDYDSFSITYSALFNTAKYVSYDAHTLGDRERFRAWKYFSIYHYTYILQLLLLIPLLVVLYKRPNAAFVFTRKISVYFIFPASAIFLLYLLI